MQGLHGGGVYTAVGAEDWLPNRCARRLARQVVPWLREASKAGPPSIPFATDFSWAFCAQGGNGAVILRID